MKQGMKRWISTLLVLSLVCAFIPSATFAVSLQPAPLVQQQTAAAVIPDTMDPDQQIYTIHLVDKPQVVLSSWNVDCLADPEAAGLLLRQAMKERKTNLTFYFEASASILFDDLINSIRDFAMAHTGNPTEGDYLKWQRGEIGANASYYTDGITNEYKLDFTITYYTTAQQEAQVDAAVAELLQSLNLNGKTDYEKLCAVYDWICSNVTYDHANLNNSTYKMKHTAYAALINRTAVCQGYAVLLYRLMLELGIDCRVVTGIGNGGDHGWNIVKLDGRYYNVDPTWDATYKQGGAAYNFFLRSNATFEDHTRDSDFTTTQFNTDYPMSTADYIPPAQNCPHNWGKGEVTKRPNCKEEGVMTYTCSLCGKTRTEPIDKTNAHTWNEGEITKQPTTESAGQMAYTCIVCGYVIYEEIPMLSHTPGDLNNDGEVTDADAIYLLYATFDPQSYPLPQNADYNSDGAVTDADAIYLLYATFDPEGYPLA